MDGCDTRGRLWANDCFAFVTVVAQMESMESSRAELEALLAAMATERRRVAAIKPVGGEDALVARVEAASKPIAALSAEVGRALGTRLLELQEELERARLEAVFSLPEVSAKLRPALRAEHDTLNALVQSHLLPHIYSAFSKTMDAFIVAQRDWEVCTQAVVAVARGLAKELHAIHVQQARAVGQPVDYSSVLLATVRRANVKH